MKARSSRRFLHPAAVLTLCLLASAAIPSVSTVNAQWLPPCVRPPWSALFFPWDRGSRVNVVIDASFTGEAAAAITRAFGNWNAERDIGGNCSDVLFLIEPSPPDLSENTIVEDVPPDHVYVVQKPIPPVGTFLNPRAGGVIVGALISLDDCLTNNDSITGVWPMR